jgi:predicted TIM-barrel fold metal-dependent hydrolase
VQATSLSSRSSLIKLVRNSYRMELKDLVLVSVDDHIVEPPEMFAGRLPKKYAASAPRVVATTNGSFVWEFEGIPATSLTTSATVGRPREEKFAEPTSFDQIRPGTYNVHERVKDMSANGVLAALNFPSFPRFCGQMFAEVAARDAELALAVVRAYNDWHIDDWCGQYPDRFIPCAIVPIWDPKLMVNEVKRVAAKGCHAVTFSMNPYKLGLPSLHSDHWDPFWAVCDELSTIVCTHLGSGSYEIITSPDAPYLTRLTILSSMLLHTAADLVWSPVLRKFKNLKFALSEGGIGWVPYFLERADYVYTHHVSWLPDHQYKDALPSELFRDHIITCFIEDEVGIGDMKYFNPDMVTWESDYPHPDSTWPLSAESAYNGANQLDDQLINKLTYQNAMRLFQFDPFTVRTRERCTVGALRGEVEGHNTSVIPGHQSNLALRTQG